MLDQVITYYENMERLKSQGVPIDWEKVAAAMAVSLRQINESQQASPTS